MSKKQYPLLVFLIVSLLFNAILFSACLYSTSKEVNQNMGIQQFGFLELGVTTSEDVKNTVPGGSFITTSYGVQAIYQVEPGIISIRFEYQNGHFVATHFEYHLPSVDK